MRYLITTNTEKPFLTEWFDIENHFNVHVEMIVYDLEEKKYTSDGKEWDDIDFDHL